MEGAAIILELRHFKSKDKKMSTKCWAFVPREMIKPGHRVELATLAKPADPRCKKCKNFNKGAPDLRVRFEVVE
jgi:hypothetical protein